jgi:hypothetical protein
MKKILNWLLIATAVVSMSACFEITEEVTLKKDGSGSYTNIMDASKMMEQLQMLAAMDTTGEMLTKTKYSLDSTFIETAKAYTKIKGIANVKMDTATPYVYRISMDFATIEALNAVMSNNKKKEDAYTWQKGKLSRNGMANSLDELKNIEQDQMEMMKSMLADMHYTIRWTMPKEIKSMTNKEAKLGSDKTTASLKVNLLDILDKKVSLANEIVYKK